MHLADEISHSNITNLLVGLRRVSFFLTNGTYAAFSVQTEELQLNLSCSTVIPQ